MGRCRRFPRTEKDRARPIERQGLALVYQESGSVAGFESANVPGETVPEFANTSLLAVNPRTSRGLPGAHARYLIAIADRGGSTRLSDWSNP